MAIRNFYMSARADGRASSIGIGPARKDGGMSAIITMRADGEIRTAVRLEAYALSDGTLRLDVIADGRGLTLVNALDTDGGMGIEHPNAFRLESQR